jgi:hemerythrin-like domain-containing protein
LGTFAPLESNKGMNNNIKNKENIMNLMSEREQLERDLIQDAKDYYDSNQSEKDLAKNYIYSAKLFIERLEELIEDNQKEIYVCIKCKTTYDKPIQQNHGHPKGVCINCAIDDYNQSTIDYSQELFKKR